MTSWKGVPMALAVGGAAAWGGKQIAETKYVQEHPMSGYAPAAAVGVGGLVLYKKYTPVGTALLVAAAVLAVQNALNKQGGGSTQPAAQPAAQLPQGSVTPQQLQQMLQQGQGTQGMTPQQLMQLAQMAQQAQQGQNALNQLGQGGSNPLGSLTNGMPGQDIFGQNANPLGGSSGPQIPNLGSLGNLGNQGLSNLGPGTGLQDTSQTAMNDTNNNFASGQGVDDALSNLGSTDGGALYRRYDAGAVLAQRAMQPIVY